MGSGCTEGSVGHPPSQIRNPALTSIPDSYDRVDTLTTRTVQPGTAPTAPYDQKHPRAGVTLSPMTALNLRTYLGAAGAGVPHECLRHGEVGLDREYVLVDIVEQNPHRSTRVHRPPAYMAP